MSRHAYLVTAYNDSYVLEQLFRLVDDDRNAIFIHLDKRFTEADPESLSRIPTRSPVVFVPRRKVFWGDYSQIAAVLSLVAGGSAWPLRLLPPGVWLRPPDQDSGRDPHLLREVPG